MANLNVWTRIARKIRRLINRNYYEGNLIEEGDLYHWLDGGQVRIVRRKLKIPLLAMEIMYFCEKK
jgi:hypothetical protein